MLNTDGEYQLLDLFSDPTQVNFKRGNTTTKWKVMWGNWKDKQKKSEEGTKRTFPHFLATHIFPSLGLAKEVDWRQSKSQRSKEENNRAIRTLSRSCSLFEQHIYLALSSCVPRVRDIRFSGYRNRLKKHFSELWKLGFPHGFLKK